MALGATPRDIVRLVVREGLIAAGIGIAAGLAAVPVTRVLAALLFGITPHDPLTFVSVSLAIMLLAATASYVPARLAIRRAPMNALRAE